MDMKDIGKLYEVLGSGSNKSVKRNYDILDALVAENEKHKEMAYSDELTGIGNRRLLEKKLTEVKSRYSRMGEKYAVVEFDIDHFGNFNNIYGHDVGDETLKHFVRTIEENIRPTDGIYREGGEEFYLILSDTKKRDARNVVSKLLKKVEENPVDVNGEKVTLTASAGVYVPKGNESSLDLKKKADLALYEAKEGGRNQTKVFYEDRN